MDGADEPHARMEMTANVSGSGPPPAAVDPRFLWSRYCEYRLAVPELGFTLDVSRVRFDDGYLDRVAPALDRAMDAMEALEAGAIANPDERRMVGHYWLRAPELAPFDQLAGRIRSGVAAVRRFARRVHEGSVRGPGGPFQHLVHVGVGGSALGSQLVCDALAGVAGRVQAHFLDNADPDAVDRLVARLDSALGRTLVSVVSKSGVTPTPNHLTAELDAAFRRRGLRLAAQAVATTMPGTPLDARAIREGWLARFPLWEWVGGRTSVTSAVGLLPAALLGADVDALLQGAAAMDRITRSRAPSRNPAALMALMWCWLGEGRGARNMVVLPYGDRLSSFPRYVQQLVMESVGKRTDRSGAVVHQGMTVYGHKGSSDQHSYVQQLRDGPADFFVTFIGLHRERRGDLVEVEAGLTLGDLLAGSLEGTRRALFERGRDSITITLGRLDESTLGALIALYERSVGLYAELIDVNAYDQPGVDKFAAARSAALQREVMSHLRAAGAAETAEEIATAVRRADEAQAVHELVSRLAEDPRRGVRRTARGSPCDERFAATDGRPDDRTFARRGRDGRH